MLLEKHTESFLREFCESLSTIERKYEIEDDAQNSVSRSTRFTADSAAYISLLVEEFIADIIEQSRKLCGNKKTVDYSHMKDLLNLDMPDISKEHQVHNVARMLQCMEVDKQVNSSE